MTQICSNNLQITAFEISLRLLLYLITGALERSTFSSSGIDSKDSSFWSREGEDKLRHGLILRLSLQHPPTLWARSEGSNVSIEGLHCTLRADLHHDNIYMYICSEKRKHFTDNSTWHLSTLLTSGNSTTCISLKPVSTSSILEKRSLRLTRRGKYGAHIDKTFPFMQFSFFCNKWYNSSCSLWIKKPKTNRSGVNIRHISLQLSINKALRQVNTTGKHFFALSKSHFQRTKIHLFP